ncbi:MAG: SUMF1/EgtB/PvdO family nonheme iron enzyme [Magnetococcus sp. DMHC-1]
MVKRIMAYFLGGMALLFVVGFGAGEAWAGKPKYTEEDLRRQCREDAAEDRIPAGEMQEYLQGCLENLARQAGLTLSGGEASAVSRDVTGSGANRGREAGAAQAKGKGPGKVAARGGDEKRVALVIGNGKYRHITPLDNPPNDARLMAKALQGVGFNLVEGQPLIDADRSAMERAVRSFGQAIRGGAVGLFYYAGHGIQVKGQNYLIPVGANVNGESDVKYELVDAAFVLDEMTNAGNRLNIVILDACRNNPFGGRGLRSVGSGLAQIQAPAGTVISYATAPGNTASDGTGANSPYTQALAKVIRTPGLDVFAAFNEVGLLVKKSTGGQQHPWLATSPIEGRFQFAGGLPEDDVSGGGDRSDQGGSGPAPIDQDAELCATLKGSENAAELDAYLKEFPDGKCAKMVRVRLTGLNKSGPATAPVTAAPAAEVVSAGGTPRSGEERDFDGMDFVWVPKGCFEMGMSDSEMALLKSDSNYDKFFKDAENRHDVCVEGFWLGKHEVTVGQFRRFVASGGYRTDAERDAGGQSGCFTFEVEDGKAVGKYRAGRSWRNPGFTQDEQHPVACVSWNDANAYADWMSGQGKGTFRLPTEAEWEYAARAGTRTQRYWGDGEKEACQYANVADRKYWTGFDCEDGYKYTAPVGRFRANGFGLFDMLGNVWEWTCSVYDATYSGKEKKCANSGDGGSVRVIRGGGWSNNPAGTRSALRNNSDPGGRNYNLGFRVSRTNP